MWRVNTTGHEQGDGPGARDAHRAGNWHNVGDKPDDMRARRASSFGTQAAAYAEYRPDYAPAAVAWALAPVRGRARVHIVDVGAGTGKLTGIIERLAATPDWAGRLSVTAVEPDPAMLAEFRRILPQTTATPGTAEHIPLPDASVDAVLCGQAAHWFDMDLAVPEVARVLTPGGVWAGLWNMEDDSEPWVAGLTEICDSSVKLSTWLTDRHDWPPTDLGAALFSPHERAEFPHVQMHTVDSLLALTATHSKMLVMDPAEHERQLSRIRDYLSARQETAHGEFRTPLLSGVLRSVKI
jgi:SAM-dependent methyltransferase